MSENGQFVTTCTRIRESTGKICGGQLYLVFAQVNVPMYRIPIQPDGFDISGDTSNEWVRCAECNRAHPLEYHEEVS